MTSTLRLLVSLAVLGTACATPPRPAPTPPQRQAEPADRGAGLERPVAPSEQARGVEPKAEEATAKAEPAPERYRFVIDPQDPQRGPPEAAVTIIMVEDFQCPFCARAEATMQTLEERFGQHLRFVFVHHPLGFHQRARPAAKAAIAAHRQGRFWEMKAKLFANQDRLEDEDLRRYAGELELDLVRFERDRAAPETDAQIEADEAQALRFDATGTPTFFINGRKVKGAQPLERFVEVVVDELNRAAELSGVPPEKLYDTLIADGLRPVEPKPEKVSRYPVPVSASMASKGRADAKLTVVLVEDFQCPFCARLEGTWAQLAPRYGDELRFVFVHNPLPFHHRARAAAKAALAAQRQGRFWEMKDTLFANQQRLEDEDLRRYAKELRLDVRRFDRDRNSSAFDEQLDAEVTFARARGAEGTPTVFVNGHQVVGAQPLEVLRRILDEELAAADAELATGTPRRALYEKLLGRANTKLNAAPKRTTLVARRALVPIEPGMPTKGRADAKLTLVLVEDLQCPFCGRLEGTLAELARRYGKELRFVFVHNPLPFHHRARAAAKAALAAQRQGRFWEMKDRLFAHQQELDDESLLRYAKELKLDLARFERDVASPELEQRIEADIAYAHARDARGTPTAFVNGRMVRGAQPLEAWRQVLDEELAAADAELKSGTPRSRLYEKLLERANTELGQEPAEDQEAPHTRAAVPILPDQPTRGAATAKVTLVVASDFQCPFCARVEQTVAGLTEKYGPDLRVVFVNYPMPFHPQAVPAARAALAAHWQGRFWEMKDLLFANQGQLYAEDLRRYARQLGLDVARFDADAASTRATQHLERDRKEIVALERDGEPGTGTPTFFINGRKVVGAQPQSVFEQVIDGELTRADALLKAGTPPDRLYEVLLTQPQP